MSKSFVVCSKENFTPDWIEEAQNFVHDQDDLNKYNIFSYEDYEEDDDDYDDDGSIRDNNKKDPNCGSIGCGCPFCMNLRLVNTLAYMFDKTNSLSIAQLGQIDKFLLEAQLQFIKL